jgi:hypothetical protein
MKVYYLDRPLTEEEAKFIQNTLETSIEQIRIPFILPAAKPTEYYNDRPMIDDKLVSNNLIKAGIKKDRGNQVGLVIPLDMHWYTAFTFAIEKMTGFHPYLIQTAEHRESIGQKGNIRIIDMEGLLGSED